MGNKYYGRRTGVSYLYDDYEDWDYEIPATPKLPDKTMPQNNVETNKFALNVKPVQNSLTKSANKAVVKFTPTALARMISLVSIVDKEVGWHGYGRKLGKGEYLIEDIYLYPQVTTGASIRTDDARYGTFDQKLLMESSPRFLQKCFHGHSHVNMATFPSGVDTDLQDDIIEMLDGSERFYIFLIINKKMDMWWKIADMEDKVLYSQAVLDTDGGELSDLIKDYIELVV